MWAAGRSDGTHNGRQPRQSRARGALTIVKEGVVSSWKKRPANFEHGVGRYAGYFPWWKDRKYEVRNSCLRLMFVMAGARPAHHVLRPFLHQEGRGCPAQGSTELTGHWGQRFRTWPGMINCATERFQIVGWAKRSVAHQTYKLLMAMCGTAQKRAPCPPYAVTDHSATRADRICESTNSQNRLRAILQAASEAMRDVGRLRPASAQSLSAFTGTSPSAGFFGRPRARTRAAGALGQQQVGAGKARCRRLKPITSSRAQPRRAAARCFQNTSPPTGSTPHRRRGPSGDALDDVTDKARAIQAQGDRRRAPVQPQAFPPMTPRRDHGAPASCPISTSGQPDPPPAPCTSNTSRVDLAAADQRMYAVPGAARKARLGIHSRRSSAMAPAVTAHTIHRQDSAVPHRDD